MTPEKKYKRLISLAEEEGTDSTPKKIIELNNLLFELDSNLVQEKDLRVIDELITTLHNTENLISEQSEKILSLQDSIRKRAS